MIWYEVYHGEFWDVYKVTENGRCYTMHKRFKTEAAVRNFAKKHWVRKWSGT